MSWTGNQDYLGPYRKAKAELPDLVARLADAVSFPDQVERADRLRSLVQEELAAVDATILVRDQVGPDQAMVVLRTLGEKRIMDTVRQVCSAISQVANEVLLTNSTEMEARYLRSRVGFWWGAAYSSCC
ncbi:MAG: CHASE3 domain-containing protein [Bryobacterales bacterium]|nr:CHASE3 domain-containing protein [Bryobacterales bacterium]